MTGLDYRYPRRESLSLDAVSFDVHPHQCVALVGPSGSGKSTLLSVIGGILRPTSGTVVMSGSQIRLADLCAWVFQANYMIPRRSATDNVALAAAGKGVTWREACRVADRNLEKLGLQARAHAKVEELSGGEVQRVAIARALAQERPIVLADEPTAQLDRRNVAMVADALVTLARSGRTVFIATHDEAVAGKCDVVLRLSDGRVVDDRGANR